jgi:hypothetical protein
MAGMFVEPFPLDFWKLERSYVLSSSQNFIACHVSLRRFIKKIRCLVPPAVSPYHRYACFTVLAFLAIPASQIPESLSLNEKQSSEAHSVCHQNDGFLIIAVFQSARRPHSRSMSPEILGRIVFFISAVGRSPPSSLHSSLC